MLMSKKICKSSHEYEDVGHYAITHFMEHERGQELVDAGRAMNFLSGIIWRSFNSSTSEYYSIYKQKGRMHSLDQKLEFDPALLNIPLDLYDHEEDYMVSAIQGILEDMMCDRNDLWYRATLFQMYLQEPNYSELARRTDIPRNSISHAVEEARQYIKIELKKQGIKWN